LEWERFGKEIEQKPLPPNPALKAVRLNKAEREVLESIRTMCLTERIYGKMPEERRQRDMKEMVERMKTCVAEDPSIKRVPTKNQRDAGPNQLVTDSDSEAQSEQQSREDAKGEPVTGANKANDEIRMTNDEKGNPKAKVQRPKSNHEKRERREKQKPEVRSQKPEVSRKKEAVQPAVPAAAPASSANPNNDPVMTAEEAEAAKPEWLLNQERHQREWQERGARADARLRDAAGEEDNWYNPYAV